MKAALRTEFRKITTTRMWWLTALTAVLYMALMGAIMAFSFVFGARQAQETGEAPAATTGGFGEAVLDPETIATTVYTLGLSLGYVFPALLGAIAVTSEFRHRTITPTLLAEPRRTVVLAAKLLAMVPFAIVMGLATTLGTVVGGAGVLMVMGEPTFLGDPDVQSTILRSVVALAIWTLVGVGFGSVLTNQVAAIVVLLAFTQFVEPLLRILLSQFEATEELSKFLPGAAGEAIAGQSLYASSGLAQLLEPGMGALVLIAYAVGLVVIGRLTTFRRDIG